MTVKQIQYYFAIYKHCNITKAAEELIVTRPVISRTLSEMEKEIGVKLFERNSSGITPTDHGVRLFHMFDCFSKTYELTINEIRNQSTENESRSLRMGMIDASIGWFYPLVYSRFQEKHPDIIVNVEGINAEDAERLLCDGTLDMAVAPIMCDDSALFGSQYLYTTQWVLCSPKNNSKAGVVKGANSEGIELSASEEFSMAILETLPAAFYRYKEIVLSTKDPEMVRLAVSGGYAHAILPLELCAHWDGVLNRPLDPPMPACIHLLWNNCIPHDPAFDIFLDFVKSIDFESLRNTQGCYIPVAENEIA